MSKPEDKKQEPTAQQRSDGLKYLIGGAALGTAIAYLLSQVVPLEYLGSPLWQYGRYILVALLAWTGYTIGVGRGHTVGENIECLAIAIVMALVLKHFIIEAYKIPTGSMQPTIIGNDESQIYDRVLVNKFSYLLEEPKRFDVIVFKFPLDRSKNYIKRLIGLPGERIVIRHGNIYVAEKGDDGAYGPLHIARKPTGVRDSVLKTLYPSGRPGETLENSFQIISGSVSTEGDEVVLAPNTLLRFGNGNSLRDRYLDGYDPDWGIPQVEHVIEGGTANVTDFAIRGQFDPASDCTELRFHIFANGIEHRAVIGVGSGRSIHLESGYPRGSRDELDPILDGPTAVVAVAEETFLEPNEWTGVSFFHVDQRLLLEIDGVEVLSYSYEISDTLNATDSGRYPYPSNTKNILELRTSGGACAIDDLKVQRDIHYLPNHPGKLQTFDIPEDGLFAMGDNTQNSSDGRMWEAQRVVLPDGKELFRGLEVGDDSAMVPREFVDIYGETYRTPVGPTPTGMEIDDSRFHFVPRHLLLGKAIAVFWPIYPHFRWKLIR